jgi:hypothetical protein
MPNFKSLIFLRLEVQATLGDVDGRVRRNQWSLWLHELQRNGAWPRLMLFGKTRLCLAEVHFLESWNMEKESVNKRVRI